MEALIALMLCLGQANTPSDFPLLSVWLFFGQGARGLVKSPVHAVVFQMQFIPMGGRKSLPKCS